jgi:long-chain acyl-CoA synthetase
MNLSDLMTESAARNGDRTAIHQDDVALTYTALERASALVAGLLEAHGFEPGDRVGVMLPNVAYFPIVYYGALRAGAAIVPMNVLLKEREVAFYMADSGAKVLFVWHEFADAAHAGARDAEVIVVEPGSFDALLAGSEPGTTAERAPDDTAVVLYTSGTTGTPKGAELTHANLAENVAVCLELFELGPDGVLLGGLPLFHAFGQTCGLNAAMAAGGSLSLLPRFDAGKALGIIQRDRVTVFEGVPTMYSAMLHHPDEFDTSSLQLCVSGGAAMPVEVLRAFERRFECTVLEGYGLSETSPVASFSRRDRERKPGSIGLPVRGVEMRIVDPLDGVGEIAIRGHNVMKGYWNKPDATASAIDADGWFHTGDLARVDEDGYFFIVDRKKEMIIRGGFNIYPREIEEVLHEHPAVMEAAVVGVPHDELGEEVGAAVVLKPGHDADANEIRRFVKERVAAYKYPRRVWFEDALPKGPTGKILRREINPPSVAQVAAASRAADTAAGSSSPG